MARVYRIQDKDGYGPYAKYSLDIVKFASDQHPMPEWDSDLKWNYLSDRYEWFFAFTSIGQMRRWFHDPRWLRTMHEAGLKLTEWEVDEDDLHASDKQAIFIRDEAQLISEQPLIH